MIQQETWVGAEQVASHLRVRKPTVYRWVKSEELPAHRMGRLLRFKLSEVDNWAKVRGAETRGSDGPGKRRHQRK